ncbi:MAG TPA: hypothetical protein VL461_10645 [Dictyobacter sp.]|nr:hypothetical protein [Dictyobacter sp.]
MRTRRVTKPKVSAVTPDIFDEAYDDIWPTRTPSSVRRYHPGDIVTETESARGDVQAVTDYERPVFRATGKHPVPARRTASQPAVATGEYRRGPIDTEDFSSAPVSSQREMAQSRQPREPKAAYQVHWLVYVGLSALIMLLGWVVLSAAMHWWQVTQDDWRYGRPRTYQIDQVVGHKDSPTNPSHFIALNLNRHVEVIEFPGGDGTNAKIYLGPVLTGPDQDLAPVTLSWKDVNGDGKVDMIINVQGSHFPLINDGQQFRAPRAGDHIHL